MIARRRLRDALRRLREAAGFTQRQVAEEMDWSLSKLIRIEAGQVTVSTTDLRALLQHYGVSEPDEVGRLVTLAKSVRERAWWSVYKTVTTPTHLAFVAYESSASVIRNFEPLLIPGLLQTPEYAREILRMEGLDNLDDHVELRMARQDLLTRDDGPEVHFIMDHAVIRRAVGGPAVMRRQLRHILELAKSPRVTVRIVPWWAGLYSRYRISYAYLEFPNPDDPDVLFLEQPTDILITVEGAPDRAPSEYLAAFWEAEQLASVALGTALLEEAVQQLSDLLERGARHSENDEETA